MDISLLGLTLNAIHAPQNKLAKNRLSNSKPLCASKAITSHSERIGALQNFAQFGLYLIGRCALHAPALAPSFQHERLVGVRIMIACQYQRRTRLETGCNRAQYVVLCVIARQVMPISPNEPSHAIRWLKGGAKFLSVEIFRAALKEGFEYWS